MTLSLLLEDLLTSKERQIECLELAAWLPIWREKQVKHCSHGPFIAAVLAASHADRLSWAFFSGYQGAIQITFPEQTREGNVCAFCVNESGRKISEIETAIVDAQGRSLLHGKKSWVLDGMQDLQMFILSRSAAGSVKGPGSLVCVQLPLRISGIALTGKQSQGPVPELPHAEVTFEGVELSVNQILEGDGYAEYAKPFRLREDIFVTGCTLAYLFGEGRLAAWPTTWAQQCIASIAGLYACSMLDPHCPETHVLTAGVLATASEAIRDTELFWESGAKDKLFRWHRDKTLLSLGKDARRQRVIKSWRSMGWHVREHTGLGDHFSGYSSL